jgi:hypothetical protein
MVILLTAQSSARYKSSRCWLPEQSRWGKNPGCGRANKAETGRLRWRSAIFRNWRSFDVFDHFNKFLG